MFYVILLFILQVALPESVFLGNFFIYISFSVVILSLHLHYIGFCIDIFVHTVMVSALSCLWMLYNLTLGCTLPWGFSYIYLLCMGYSNTVLPLHLLLYWYICECYIYFYWNMVVYFIRATHWLYSILRGLSVIVPVYGLLCHLIHTNLPLFIKV